MKEWYQQSSDSVRKEMGTGQDGLSEKDAKRLLEEKGPNALKEGKKKSTLQVFLEQFLRFDGYHPSDSSGNFDGIRKYGEYHCHCGRSDHECSIGNCAE